MAPPVANSLTQAANKIPELRGFKVDEARHIATKKGTKVHWNGKTFFVGSDGRIKIKGKVVGRITEDAAKKLLFRAETSRVMKGLTRFRGLTNCERKAVGGSLRKFFERVLSGANPLKAFKEIPHSFKMHEAMCMFTQHHNESKSVLKPQNKVGTYRTVGTYEPLEFLRTLK